MTFEWDAQKSISNQEKHGIGFDTAKKLWLDDKRVEIQIAFPSEDRWALIAAVEGKIWTAIYNDAKRCYPCHLGQACKGKRGKTL